jgi:spermidine/putrescine transport system ATP-binding protein
MGGGEVRLVGLVKRFEDVTAVDGIDLQVHGGELFSLLGPSGCGKTTTLRLVAGFEQPSAGRILLDGVDMARTPPHKRKVNTVFQSYALFPFMNVHDNVAFGLRFQDVSRAEARRRVAAALEQVRLQGFQRAGRRSSPAASSSGWRWPGRWCWSRRCCCWTSRSARWTPSCARRSRWS